MIFPSLGFKPYYPTANMTKKRKAQKPQLITTYFQQIISVVGLLKRIQALIPKINFLKNKFPVDLGYHKYWNNE